MHLENGRKGNQDTLNHSCFNNFMGHFLYIPFVDRFRLKQKEKFSTCDVKVTVYLIHPEGLTQKTVVFSESQVVFT